MNNFLTKLGILCGSVIIMLMAALLIVLVHLAKLFRKYCYMRNPFHDSRQHPLNSAEAPRG